MGEDVAGGGVTDDELEDDEKGGVKPGAKKRNGGRAEEDCEKSLDKVPRFGSLRFHPDKPKSVAEGEEIMDGQSFRSGEESEENERKTDDKINEVGF